MLEIYEEPERPSTHFLKTRHFFAILRIFVANRLFNAEMQMVELPAGVEAID